MQTKSLAFISNIRRPCDMLDHIACLVRASTEIDIANKIPDRPAAPAKLRKGQLFRWNKQLDDGSI